jgi:DNA-binding transcriptional LysR family regulator
MIDKATDPRRATSLNKADESRFARLVDWNLFCVFREIIRLGSVSAAARVLNRQQPSVSAGLKRLEDHLGVMLCERTPRGVVPTPAGRALYALCEEMHERVTRIPEETAAAMGRSPRQVRLLMISDLVSPTLDRATAMFHHQHPDVAVRLEIAPWRSVVTALEAGDADIGVTCDNASSTELNYRPLLVETQQLYCGKPHLLYGTGARAPGAYAGQGFVLTGQDEPEELTWFRRRHGLGGQVTGAAETLGEVRRLIELGIGVGFLPTVVGEKPGSGPPLWPLLHARDLPSYQVYLVSNPSTLSAEARAMIETIEAAGTAEQRTGSEET